MIRYNEKNGKIQLATLELVPQNAFEEKMLRKFAALSTDQRCELITLGFEALARIYQHNADVVAGV